MGFLTQFARQSASEVTRQASDLALRAMAESARRSQVAGIRSYHRILLNIGWETPPTAAIVPVVTSGYLDQVLDLQRKPADLPMIYRRLFRLAPVEEARFLVGREAEMGALGHARACGKPATPFGGSGGREGKRQDQSLELLPGRRVRRNRHDPKSFFRAHHGRGGNCATSFASSSAWRIRTTCCKSLPPGGESSSSRRWSARFSRRMDGFEGIQDLAAIISATSRSTFGSSA